MCFFSIKQQQKIYEARLQNTKDYTLHEFALCRSITTKSRLYHYIPLMYQT